MPAIAVRLNLRVKPQKETEALNIAESARLSLRRIELIDAAFLCRLLNEPSWLENIGDRGVRTTQDAEQYIQTKVHETYEAHGFGMYLVESKHDRVAIGLCGLVSRESLGGVDLGFALLPQFWGQGLAFEAASAVMTHARESLSLTRLLAIVAPRNVRSSQLLENLGFEFRRMVRLTPEAEELRLYEAAMRTVP